jgi:AsmA protein
VPELEIGELLKTVSSEHVASGPVALRMALRMRGSAREELTETAEGTASLVGEDLTLHGRDLDRDLKRYRAIQSFNLVDLGGLFLAGPLGLTVTRGYTFASVFRGSDGNTRIRKLVSEWEVEGGVAHAKDVALTTEENRLALRGGLDFGGEEFRDVTVALLDPDGCVYVSQRILGPFGKPVVERPNFLKTIASPVIKLAQRVRRIFPHKDCEVFYAGSLVHPPPAEKSKKD